MAPGRPGATLQPAVEYVELVASDSYRRLFVGLGDGAVAVRMAVAIAIPDRRSNRDRLAGVREIGRHGLSDVADRSDLHHRRLRLLQHQLFVNRANLGLLLISLLAPSAVFF